MKNKKTPQPASAVTSNPIIVTTTGTSSTNAVWPATTTYGSTGMIGYATSGYIVPNSVYIGSGELYEKDDCLYYKNSKGEIQKLTFTKNENITNIINNL